MDGGCPFALEAGGKKGGERVKAQYTSNKGGGAARATYAHGGGSGYAGSWAARAGQPNRGRQQALSALINQKHRLPAAGWPG